MRWILLILVFALTWGLFYAIPYLAEIGWTLMSWTGWTLLPGALIVAYIGFVGPLWGKALEALPQQSRRAAFSAASRPRRQRQVVARAYQAITALRAAITRPSSSRMPTDITSPAASASMPAA